MTNILRCISPVDNQVYVERQLATEKDVEKTLYQAEIAQPEWSKVSLDKRQEIIRRAIDIIESKKTALAKEITLQMGRPINTALNEIDGVKERANYMIDIAEKALSPYRPEEINGFERFIIREPVGVVAVIAPWNYPYLTAINVIIPALIAGNSVVLKHASQTPLCAEQLHTIFLEAGLPEHVFQYLHLSHTNTEKMLQDPRVGYVNFTGSVPAGHRIQNSIRDKFVIAGLELGGKDPAYVRSDADLEFTAQNLVDGTFYNSGQSCCGIERIYVHQSVFDSFVSRFVEIVNKYQLGNPTHPETTLGPMVKTSAADFVRGQITDAISKGAQSLIDETNFSKSQSGTPYLAPQVLVNVNHSMRVMTEESFGPVVGIMQVDSDQEAIQRMNDSDFGLTASVWTEDIEAVKKIGPQIKTGTFFMNRCDYLDPALAWTGVKDTGRGCSLSVYGYDALTRFKSYHLKTKK